ncbi:MAG TPA: pyridoxal-phosphate dependent enzyme [Candidatus Acidoferrales bacterium]|nr:pyridoxal-phosphate dependent enzyme [Candidatus Acidoferrales bacterium]
MHSGPDFNDIRAASGRIAAQIHRTPVLTSELLDKIAGARLFFKCENFQKTGSFKIRGATNAVLSLPEDSAQRGVVTHSSGNHAAALARAAQLRGIPAWIVMPSNAPAVKRAAVEAYGGTITFCEPTLAARESTAQDLLQKTGAQMIHPYDNRNVIAGQGTAALELLNEVADLDFILAPVSGGGLLSGTAIAAKAMNPKIRVIGCEPKNADDAFRSMASGQLEPAAKSETIADGLRATLCPLTFSILRECVDQVVTVTEVEIGNAMRTIWERMKIVIEPSAAVAAAPALLRRLGADGERVGIILSGGNVDLSHLPF